MRVTLIKKKNAAPTGNNGTKRKMEKNLEAPTGNYDDNSRR
jgi:hypothetical protein